MSLLPPSTGATAWGAAMFELTRRKEGRASNRAAFTDYRSSVSCIYLFIYIYFVCVIKVATHVLDAMDAAIF